MRSTERASILLSEGMVGRDAPIPMSECRLWLADAVIPPAPSAGGSTAVWLWQTHCMALSLLPRHFWQALAAVAVLMLMLAACRADAPDEPVPRVAGEELTQAAEIAPGELPVGHTREGFLYLGSPEAPLVLYEIFNANCPGCGNHHRSRLPSLVREHVQSGVVQMVLVDLAISPEWGEQAHFTAWCLGRQVGAQSQWQFWTDLYEGQASWIAEGEEFSLRLAEEAGAEVSVLQTCIETQAPAAVAELQAIAEDRLLPERWSTPVFRIEDRTGRFLASQVGSPSLEAWQRLVEQALAVASW